MEPEITISFDQEPPQYQTGQVVSGQVAIYSFEATPIERVEVSVLWHTLGKGTEDQSVIYLKPTLQDGTLHSSVNIPFRVQLPDLPISYQGRLINIHWVVRAHIFPNRGDSFGSEARFQVIAPITADKTMSEF